MKPGFWRRLFCIHRYAPIDIWGDYKDKNGNLYWDKVCTKCGRVTQHYYLGRNILRDKDVIYLIKIGVLKEKK